MDDPAPPVPTVIHGLIALNVLVYAIWHTWGLDHPGFMLDQFVVSLDAVLAGRVWTLLTSAVSHVDAMHLLINLIALWVFGVPVARVLGTGRFLAVYVGGAMTASLAHMAWNLVSGDGAGALGASGAIAAFAVIFALWFPRATMLVMFIVPMPAWMAAVLFLALDVLGVFGTEVALLAEGQDAGVAHAAHLGGALVGLVAGLALRPRAEARPAA